MCLQRKGFCLLRTAPDAIGAYGKNLRERGPFLPADLTYFCPFFIPVDHGRSADQRNRPTRREKPYRPLVHRAVTGP